MSNYKVIFGLSLPLAASLYLILENILYGASYLSLPISIALFAVFLIISIVSLMYRSEVQEKQNM